MTPARLDEILARFERLAICVVGDLFLDRYVDIDRSLAEVSLETGLEAHQAVGIRNCPGAAGIALGNLCSLVCPERIVIGGGVAEIGDVLLDPLRRETRAHTVGPFHGCTAIVQGRVGQLAVPVGALLLAGDALKR